ncbi:hypothetical protein Q3V94_07115 [Caloramator sp. CAR-1]|uniref:hypothetical protein n=1 Tax=Caloramator sp. CAR-1 TaxID=3062777 RepID=UPI0026E1C65F|nr:hypothetical protein [Caloramator sp. CAR-1]MDO6354849.1 hypothetical protein [Caloramator sp. CAR-1]
MHYLADYSFLFALINDNIYIKEIADALKPKTNYLLGILWGIAGLIIMYVLYVMFNMLDKTMGM